jgi:hypothetical protein
LRDFELLRGAYGGYGKILLRLSPTEPVPPVSYLKAARISTVYIRPLEDIEIVNYKYQIAKRFDK